MRRLSQAGFKRDFVRPAVLPDWWDDECAADEDLLPDVEFRIARFLGRSVSDVRDPSVQLSAPAYEHAQLRRVRDIDRDRLSPAIHTALQVAASVARSMRAPTTPWEPIPPDGLAWRRELTGASTSVNLATLVEDLWTRGVPVIPVDTLPSPRFQGLACIVEGRPVIVLGHRHDEPGRVAFVVAHEAGHVAAGDCTPGNPVVDEDEGVIDESEMERLADLYATRVLVGADSIPNVDAIGFRDLAKAAADHERQTGADASAIIYSWARRSGDFAKATMAIKALYRAHGARQTLRQIFDRHVDLDNASESDRLLMRCVYGDPVSNAAAS